MKIRHIIIVFVLSTLLLSGCNSDYKLSAVSCIPKSEAVEMLVNTLMQDTSIPTFNAKQGTVEGYVATEETTTEEVITGEENYLNAADHDAPPEGTQFVGTEVSKFAGTTSKHGYKYPDDYIEGGPKDEDRIGDVEMLFDIGALTEEEYQEDLEFFSKSKEEITQELMDDMGISDSGEESGGTVPGNSGAPIELPPAKEYVPDGNICY